MLVVMFQGLIVHCLVQAEFSVDLEGSRMEQGGAWMDRGARMLLYSDAAFDAVSCKEGRECHANH